MDIRNRRPVWLWAVLGTITVLVVAFAFQAPAVKHLAIGALVWAKVLMNDHPVVGVLVFFLFAAISAIFAFASSAILVPPANLVWGQVITFFLLLGGWVAGATVAYGIGRLASPLLFRFGYRETWEKYRQFVSTRMQFWAVLAFCLAVPSEVPGYLLGGMRYPYWKFLAAIATAESVFAFGIVVAGESLLSADHTTLFVAIGVLLVIAAAGGVMLRAVRRHRARDAV